MYIEVLFYEICNLLFNSYDHARVSGLGRSLIFVLYCSLRVCCIPLNIKQYKSEQCTLYLEKFRSFSVVNIIHGFLSF